MLRWPAGGLVAVHAAAAGCMQRPGLGVPLHRLLFCRHPTLPSWPRPRLLFTPGVSVGLMSESGFAGEARELPVAPVGAAAVPPPLGRHELLTDLQGVEDQLGDMDLKVAGALRWACCVLRMLWHAVAPRCAVHLQQPAVRIGQGRRCTALSAACPKPRAPCRAAPAPPAQAHGRGLPRCSWT